MTVIGALGFVGSAIITNLGTRLGVQIIAVTRSNYHEHRGISSDVVIDASCNSKKFLADERPAEEFELSVAHRLRTLTDFPADLHVHISSVDVYSDLSSPETTREDASIDLSRVSHYGCHKLLAENLVRHYARRWLIVRLAGMVGPGLRKNPVYDILNGRPLRIHPDSQYQFIPTSAVASTIWLLTQSGYIGEIFNVCGDGVISPREISNLANKQLVMSQDTIADQPRIVHANIEKIRQLTSIPNTVETIAIFIEQTNRLKV